MPRTKSVKPNVDQLNVLSKRQKDQMIKNIDVDAKMLLIKIGEAGMGIRQAIQSEFVNVAFKCGQGYIHNKTIGELKQLPRDYSETATMSTMSSVLMNSTRPKRQLVRSSSFHDDGYLTADSNGSSGGARRSRSKVKTAVKAPVRPSRSLSARKTPNKKVPSVNTLTVTKTAKTNKKSSTSYGLITPKVTPNTPQVVLRRPMHGEVAVSLQGSPLYTGSVPTESEPNVNIPLNDGRLLSLQPQRGLRVSLVPILDHGTRNKLMLLRDNLDKLCGVAQVRRQ